MSREKVGILFWIYWIGFILIGYGIITFITSVWSTEARETAGVFGLYGAPIITIIGIVFVLVGALKK